MNQAIATPAAVATPTQPNPDSKPVLGFRPVGGLFDRDPVENFGPYHLEITDDGYIWGKDPATGAVMSLYKDEFFPTEPQQVGGSLGDFLQKADTPVMMGQWEMFDPATGAKFESDPEMGWDGKKFHVGVTQAQLTDLARANGHEQSVDLMSGEVLA